jgi:hypothetical protein
MEVLLKFANIKIFRKEIYLLLRDGEIIGGNVVERVDVVVAGVVVVVVVVVVVGSVGITIGTMTSVRMILTTVFINGYGPRLQNFPEKSSRSGAHIITPPRSFPII